jgi:ABC-type Zn uptake system ZnuABC Zn-binding protein ZnuA
MKKQTIHLLATLLISIAVFSGCGSSENNQKLITVSILPQKYFVDILTNEAIEVNVMVPPGASHATYSPTSQQFKKLSDSKLYIGIGHLGFEQVWMPRLSELNKEMKTVILSDHLELIAGECEHEQDHKHDHGEPSPAYLAKVIKKAKEESIPVIFIQEEYDIRNAQTISQEAGIALVQINPMNYNWLQSMNELTQTLQNYLNE